MDYFPSLPPRTFWAIIPGTLQVLLAFRNVSVNKDIGSSKKMPVYRLCGFSGILGLRPTAFQELLHLTRICGLCGVVPERTSLLPCGHALCQLCLDGMVSKGSVCPVDGGEFLGHDTPRLEFTSGDIAKYKVSSIMRLIRSIGHHNRVSE